jgi:hypothetical protein
MAPKLIVARTEAHDPTLYFGPASSPEEAERRAEAVRRRMEDEEARLQAAVVAAVPAAARPLAKLNALQGRRTTWWARVLPECLRRMARPRSSRTRRVLRVRSSSASRDGPGEPDPPLARPGRAGLVGVEA